MPRLVRPLRWKPGLALNVALAAAKLEREMLCKQAGLGPDASSDILLARVTAWSKATTPAAETHSPAIPTGYRRLGACRIGAVAIGNDHEVFEAESFAEAVQMCRDTLAARAARTPAPTSGKTAP